jgi:serine/threonine-protein kinase
VKPETIFLVHGIPYPDVKLIDFGLAKVIGGNLQDPNLTRHGKLIGTPPYVSPERASAKRPTPHADMWALAVTAYHALTGQLPFAGDQLGIMLVRIIQGDFTPPTRLREGLGPDIDAFFKVAFAAQPDDRHRDVLELAESFSAALAAGSDDLDWSL